MAKTELNGFPIPWIPTNRPENEDSCYPYKKQTPKTTKLPVGWTFAAGRRPVHEPLIFEEAHAIPLRDGAKVRLL